jgi:hypothetical protein
VRVRVLRQRSWMSPEDAPLTGQDVGVGDRWYIVVVVCALIAAYVVPRFLLRPEWRPWQIWAPAALAVAVIIGALATGNWGLAGIFAVFMPIEIWRTLPTWRLLRRQPDGVNGSSDS